MSGRPIHCNAGFARAGPDSLGLASRFQPNYNNQGMNWRRFLGELQRRNVYRVAVTYTVVSWVLIQIATQVFPSFEIPAWAVRVVVLLLALGFPVALIFAWAFELTPEGIKRTEDVPRDESIRHHTGRKLLALAAVAAAIAVGLYLLPFAWRGSSSAKQDAAPVSPVSGAIPEKSIAVLPFSNLSGEQENAFFYGRHPGRSSGQSREGRGVESD